MIPRTVTIRYCRNPISAVPDDWRVRTTWKCAICNRGLMEQFDYPADLTEIWVEITDTDPQDEEAMEIFNVRNCSFYCQDERQPFQIKEYDLHRPFYEQVLSVIGDGKGWMRVWY